MVQVRAESIEFPDDERVSVAKGFEACRKSWTVVLLSRRVILIQQFLVDAGFDERVALRTVVAHQGSIRQERRYGAGVPGTGLAAGGSPPTWIRTPSRSSTW